MCKYFMREMVQAAKGLDLSQAFRSRMAREAVRTETRIWNSKCHAIISRDLHEEI
jgi:hypothetical protein